MAIDTAAQWLEEYHSLDAEKAQVEKMFEDANCGEGSFESADTASFDLNEKYRDLAHVAAEVLDAILAGQRTVTEWGFRHPGFPHADIAPHVETQYTGQDGWHVGPYTEKDVHSHANGRPVVKRTRVVTPDVIGEWQDICDRHGGVWGDDETCARCTFENGTVRPLDDKGPLRPEVEA
jgi:hypothetical protein